MELKQKVVLKQKGEKTGLVGTEFVATLRWTAAVDLDLHAFYKTKTGKFEHVYFANKGSLSEQPYIQLDEDEGVGNTAGDNEENIRISKLDHLDSVLIATNIFRFLGFLSKGDNFAKYDGSVVVKSNTGDVIEVPLISEEPGKWCLIAKIDNSGASPCVININRVQKNEPKENDV
jgi:tellurite resistance protein TerA